MKPSVQLPIVAGYGAASLFARWSVRAHRKAEMLSLMVNDPNIAPEELAELRVPTLVVAGTRDMIKEEHYQVDREEHSRRKAGLRGGGSLRGCGEPRGVQQGREEVFGKLINLARMLMQYACKIA